MSAALLAPGQLLEGKYEIVRVVGEGAWGEVLEGINVRIKRRVAIKILKAEYASNEQMVSRFEREALASTHIESPHVVQVFDAGVLSDGRPYLVMEFLTGEDLSARIEKEGKLPILDAVELCAQAARGLAAAHAAGVFHRDMKPSNIVVAKTKAGAEIAKIVDFGISKLLDTQSESQSNTQTGTILGSPVYMSPEQARGSKATDHRSDIYSLGVVLFEALTGRTPHVADSFNELLFKIVLEEVPSARQFRPEIDEELDAILRHALAKAPEGRPASAADLDAALSGWLANHGGKVVDWRTDSGTRPHDRAAIAAAGLTSSPVISAAPRARMASSPVISGGGAEGAFTQSATVEIQAADRPATSAETIPAPKEDGTPGGVAGGTAKPARPAWVLPVVGLAVVAVGVGAFLATRGSGAHAGGSTTNATNAPTVTAPTATATPTATASATASAVASVAAPASASASAAESASAAPATPVKPVVGVAPVRPRNPTTTAPPAASPAAPAANPATTSSASVGGRTIRTDL